MYFPSSEAPAVVHEAVSTAVPQGHGETILIVEDEIALLDVTSRMLRRNGYEVSGAATYQQALSLAADYDFDLLLTDVVMPGMSGREVARYVQAIDPGTVVLYMSGYSGGVLGSQLMPDDHVTLIQKPFTQLSLLKKVNEALASRTHRHALQIAPSSSTR